MSASLTAPAPATGGAPPANMNTKSNSTGPSYAMVTKSACTTPTLISVPLANRPISYVEGIPAIILTSIEEDQLRKQRENTLIMKFSAGMPNLYEIRSHIHSEWNLERAPAVGILDQRHVTLHMASTMDTNRALARTKNKITTSMFRLFRWTPEFEIGKDSSLAAVWVKMYNLPLHYFNESSITRLGSILGNVVGVHPSTKNLTQQRYAKVCVELDVSQPLLEKLWIGTSKDYGWEISLEYEGNHAYCEYCGLLGHTLGLCRKKREDQGKAAVKEGRERTETNNQKQWVMKNKIAQPTTEKVATQVPQVTNSEDNIMGHKTPQIGSIILRNKEPDMLEDTRQILIQAGLASTSHSENLLADGFLHDDPQASINQNKQSGILAEANSRESNKVAPSPVLDNYNKTVGRHEVTPLRNNFSVLDTEGELQEAFSNLQRSKEPSPQAVMNTRDFHLLAIVDEYLSDGAGTRDKSNIGVQFTSAPNSEGEGDGQDEAGKRIRKNKKHGAAIRRSTRTVKAKTGLDSYHY